MIVVAHPDDPDVYAREVIEQTLAQASDRFEGRPAVAFEVLG